MPRPKADFTGQTIIITGANRCLGFEAALHFVTLNASKVILGCRNVSDGLESQKKIERATSRLGVLDVWEVDLGTSSSVERFCERAAHLERLDVVVENAALMTSKYECFEGHERQVTVNIISTWLMALMLLPLMKRTNRLFYQSSKGHPHLVIVGSNAHFYATFNSRKKDSIFESLKDDSDMVLRYHDTKLISLLFARALSNRMRASGRGLTVILNMVDPGYCQSDLMRDGPYPFPVNHILSILYWVLARTAEMGSRTYISAATAGVESHGMYLEDCGLSTPSAFVTSPDGRIAQERVFEELSSILESIKPGIIAEI